MKTGYEEIKQLIYDQLVRANANLPIGRNKFSKDLAKKIYELLEPEMNAEWNNAHGFPQELEQIVRKLENGLGLRMKRDERAAEVYKWIIEQEKNGRSVGKFIAWAVDRQRVQFVGKYRNSPEAIRIDYKMVFEGGSGTNTPKAEML